MLFAMTAIVLAGIFCFQGVYTMSHDCMGETSNLWCDDLVSHNTLISYALISIVLTVSLLLIAVCTTFIDYGKRLQLLHIMASYRHRTDFTALHMPLQFAFSRGIIHPYIP